MYLRVFIQKSAFLKRTSGFLCFGIWQHCGSGTSEVSALQVTSDSSKTGLMGIQVTKILRPSTTKMASSPEIQQYIKDIITKEKVVVFSKTYCPYCTMAKQVFEKVKQPFHAIELDQRDDGSDIQGNLASITGIRTVPQVFINGNCVGGGTDVKALHESGKLESMLIG